MLSATAQDESNLGFEESTSYSRYAGHDTSFKEEYKSEEFDYTEREKTKPREAKRTSFNINFGGLAQVLFYGFLTLVVGFIIYFIVKGIKAFNLTRQQKRKSIAHEVSQEDNGTDNDEIEADDLIARLNSAKQAGNYRLAIRYYFLLYLERLEQSELIVYHKDKTNQDYVDELNTEKQIADFVRLSYPFEYVWYGQKTIDQNTYLSLERLFESQLKNNK